MLYRTGDPYGPWWKHSVVFFDVETTGLEAEDGDRVVEVGFVRFEDGKPTDRWGSLVYPQRLIPEEATAIHGISQLDVSSAPTFPGIMSRALQICRDAWPAAYNASFDRRFWAMETEKIGLGGRMDTPIFSAEHRWLDPLVWVRKFDGIWAGNKLTAACERYGVSLESAHRATDDATAAGLLLFDVLRERLPNVTMFELLRRQEYYHREQERERREWFAKKGIPYK